MGSGVLARYPFQGRIITKSLKCEGLGDAIHLIIVFALRKRQQLGLEFG